MRKWHVLLVVAMVAAAVVAAVVVVMENKNLLNKIKKRVCGNARSLVFTS